MNFNYEDLIFVVCGHQNTEEKKDILVDQLKNLKSEGFKVCYSTHCGDYLDEISKHCDYISYDNNNDFVYDGDIMSGLNYIRESDIKNFIHNRQGYHRYYNYDNYRVCDYMHDTYHSKPALSLFRSGSQTAIQNGYTWIMYLEYDIMYPKNGYRDIIEDILIKTEDINYKSYFLNRNNKESKLDPFIWTGFFLTHISNLSGEFLIGDWVNDKREFVKKFGISHFERIISNNVLRLDKCYIDHLPEEINTYWDVNDILDLNNVISINGGLESNINCSFYVLKENDKYYLKVFSYLVPDIINKCQIHDFKVTMNGEVIYNTSFEINGSNYWIFDIGEVTNNTTYELEYKYDDNYRKSKLSSDQIEKVYLLKSIINI